MKEKDMQNENINLKSLSELKDMTFFVESYQRGYKWDEQQVLDLLNDLNEFEVIGNKFYCLQPVVVYKIGSKDKKLSEYEIKNNENVYELIDGQQRLTTLFIIISTIAKEQLPFKIIYKTRPKSESFLNSITKLEPYNLVNLNDQKELISELNLYWEAFLKNDSDDDNVDNYHFFKAYQVVKNWTDKMVENKKEDFIVKLLNHVKVIWYKIEMIQNFPNDSPNAEKIFLNFNLGKIQLEQAELIKAFFIIEYKKMKNYELRGIKITQFADEWNNIESQLQDDQFWYFINNDNSDKKKYNRIDFLFDVMTEKPKNSEDQLFAYHFYMNSNKNTKSPEFIWNHLNKLFSTLREWFENRNIYHLLGIVVYLEIKSIPELIQIYNDKNKVTDKTKFESELKKWILEELDNEKYSRSVINYNTAVETKTILTLFNIATYQISDFNYRFPFDKLKTTNWSLEHIHAQKAEEFKTKDEFEDLLIDIEPLIKDFEINKDKERVDLLSKLKTHEIKEIRNELIDFYNLIKEEMKTDHYSNLCLLDKNTNASFGNRNFKKKREKMIEIDSKGEVDVESKKEKVFIPICTKNVFLKYYTKEIDRLQFTYWGKTDREDYEISIDNTIIQFLK
jgi:uncharacterized protein with ParB-like and HNH nuclease domain